MCSDKTDMVDWANQPLEVIQHIHQQAVLYLDGQFRAALAADQRASTAGSVLVAASVALVAASLAFFSTAQETAVLVVGIMTAMVLLIGAGCCLWAARPVDFYSPGNEPASWWRETHTDLKESLGAECEVYQEMINENVTVLEDNGAWLTFGLRIAALSPVAGFFVWLVL